MPEYGNELETEARRPDVIFAGIVLILALSTSYLSEANQQRVSSTLQATVLRPFIATQNRITEARLRAVQVDSLTDQLDSLSAVLSTHSVLMGENQSLRELLGLAERAGPTYLPATVLRPGTPGSESMFLVDVGSDDGVRRGAPVVSPEGLVGVIREVRSTSSVGMDWSHPEFRASAMLVDGTAYGLVENRRGRFREEDRLLLNGVAFNQQVYEGTAVVTSGLGGVFPRGIPIGRVSGVAEEEGGWRKSYWMEPMVEAGSATHVLVLTRGPSDDVSAIWPSDSLFAPEAGRGGDRE